MVKEFEKVINRSKTDLVLEQLLLSIKQKNYGVGERIPTEKKISEEMEVSRAVVREALTTLRSIGVVESKVGKGSFVRNYDKDLIEAVLKSINRK